jgi:hypothetical protein
MFHGQIFYYSSNNQCYNSFDNTFEVVEFVLIRAISSECQLEFIAALRRYFPDRIKDDGSETMR